jgi:hypothetical protein
MIVRLAFTLLQKSNGLPKLVIVAAAESVMHIRNTKWDPYYQAPPEAHNYFLVNGFTDTENKVERGWSCRHRTKNGP